MQAELQREGDAAAEGEDAVVEEAAVTGTHPCSPLGAQTMLTHAPGGCMLREVSYRASGSLSDYVFGRMIHLPTHKPFTTFRACKFLRMVL